MKKEKTLREIIVQKTSEMLDNPNEYGIYPTTKFYDNLEREIYELFSNKNNSGGMKIELKPKEVLLLAMLLNVAIGELGSTNEEREGEIFAREILDKINELEKRKYERKI